MLTIDYDKKTLRGFAKVRDIKRYGLIKASMMEVKQNG